MEYRNMMGTQPEPSLLGYGCMRFPVDKQTKKIDQEAAMALIRQGMEGGITYYDTAWPYHEGESEAFMGQALSHYPRAHYCLATKLPCWLVKSREQAEEIIAQQLQRLGTDYIDFYLLHSLTRLSWDTMVDLGILQLLKEYQRRGVLRRIGFSFHDSYAVFEEIINYQSWDFCQIQLNYMDINHQAGLRGLALAHSMGVPVVVMEPVKGGSLAQLPDEVMAPLSALDPAASAASWAMRWVASQPGVAVVLSGMSNAEQVADNLNSCTPFVPLTQAELQAVEETARLLKLRLRNGCTSCKYCMPCPVGVDIPGSFQLWNNMSAYQNKSLTRWAWKNQQEAARPSNCIGCGHCVALCPQHIAIPADLARITPELEGFLGK